VRGRDSLLDRKEWGGSAHLWSDSLIRLVRISLRVDGLWWNERGWRVPAMIEGGEQNGASRAI
jgi:hypothetical protein